MPVYTPRQGEWQISESHARVIRARLTGGRRAAQVIGDEGDIEKQRHDLEAERKAFSEATQRLGEERRRLEVSCQT